MYKFPLTLLLFKVGRAIHSLLALIVSTSFNQPNHYLTKLIFDLHPWLGQAILIRNIMILGQLN